MKRLFTYLKDSKTAIAIGTAIKIVGTMMDLFIPYVLAHLLDNVVPAKSLSRAFFWGGAMIVFSVLAFVMNVLANRMASLVACDTTRALRHDLFAKISYLSSEKTDRFSIASLESRLTSDTYNVNHMIGMSLRLGIRAPILLIGGIVMTAFLDLRLTAVMLLTLPFVYLAVRSASTAGISLYKLLQKKNDEFTRVVREDATGIRVIKALSKTAYEKSRFDSANRDAIEVEKRAGVTMARLNPITTFVLNAGMCAVILAGGFFVTKELTTSGTIIAFMSYFTIIANALINVSRIFVNISKGSASMARIDEVLSEAYELTFDGDMPETDENAPFIEFRNVSFSYGKHRVLENISFTLMRGETLGMIGATGSGKSTVINLLMRFYDPDEGDIYLEGVNIREYPTRALRQKFGVVFQNDFLFADTIEENIRFGREEISRADIEKAAEYAQAKSFIEMRREGYFDMLTIKGANLSGGQKQRTLIARALAADPEILVLDDSSSALDYKTDALLRASLAAHFSKITAIVVAQRVSSIVSADKILVLSEGKILAMGTHSELLESCSEYAEISESQMGGAILD